MRIGIVEDMELAVEVIRRVLIYVPEHEVIWVARDGAEAVDRCADDRPDLVLMDLYMPGMDGVEATRRIMEATPCAILVVTASVEQHAGRVFQAMGNGALDAVDTPVADGAEGGDRLLEKIATIGKLIGKHSKPKRRAAPEPAAALGDPMPPIVAIGASTGGPLALTTILTELPPDFPGAVIIVQHVDSQFMAGLTDWLAQKSTLPVRIARRGDRPVAGQVLLAGGEDHLEVTSAGVLRYTPEPLEAPFRPSVDVFFASAARHWPPGNTAVLLTGMGSDGAQGLLQLQQAGWKTIAQDRETSVVYGMPRAAAELGAARHILPITRIAAAVAAGQPARSLARRARSDVPTGSGSLRPRR